MKENPSDIRGFLKQNLESIEVEEIAKIWEDLRGEIIRKHI